jgi:hypothetical protein
VRYREIGLGDAGLDALIKRQLDRLTPQHRTHRQDTALALLAVPVCANGGIVPFV